MTNNMIAAGALAGWASCLLVLILTGGVVVAAVSWIRLIGRDTDERRSI
jgi:hypothetical protein